MPRLSLDFRWGLEWCRLCLKPWPSCFHSPFPLKSGKRHCAPDSAVLATPCASPMLGWNRRPSPDSSLRVRATIFLLPMREKVAGGRMRVGAFFTRKRHDIRLADSSLTLPSPSRERVFSVPSQKPSCASCTSWLIQSDWPSAACLPEAIALACRHVIAGHHRGTNAPLGGGHLGDRQNRGRGHRSGRRDRGPSRPRIDPTWRFHPVTLRQGPQRRRRPRHG